jgi:hypothetical protein
MTVWFRAIFLFSSFGPLYLLLATSLYVQGFPGWHWALLLFALSVCIFLFLRSRFKRKSVFRKRVKIEGSLDESIFAYLVSYLPPLMTDDFTETKKLAPIVVFYIVTILLLFRSEATYINPYFILFGYRIIQVRLEGSNRSVVLITMREDLVDDEIVSLYEVQPSRVYFAE